jgi:hypothetical protein
MKRHPIFSGLLLLVLGAGLFSCQRSSVAEQLEKKTRELSQVLYANVTDTLATRGKYTFGTGVEAPAFLPEEMGPYFRLEFFSPQEVTMAGETYNTFKALYEHESGKKFAFSLSDMQGTEVLKENRQRRASNVEAFENDEEKLVLIPYESEVMGGYYLFNKKEGRGQIVMFLYNRYFLEISSQEGQEISERELLALMIHLPYDKLKK